MEITKTSTSDQARQQKQRRSTTIADEPTKAEIMEDIRIGLQQAAAGEGRPAREVFRELRRKTAGNAHSH